MSESVKVIIKPEKILDEKEDSFFTGLTFDDLELTFDHFPLPGSVWRVEGSPLITLNDFLSKKTAIRFTRVDGYKDTWPTPLEKDK